MLVPQKKTNEQKRSCDFTSRLLYRVKYLIQKLLLTKYLASVNVASSKMFSINAIKSKDEFNSLTQP